MQHITFLLLARELEDNVYLVYKKMDPTGKSKLRVKILQQNSKYLFRSLENDFKRPAYKLDQQSEFS